MNIQQVWQSQASEAPRISIEYVRHGARALERRARWRNALEYGSAVFGCGFSLVVAWQAAPGRPILLAGLFGMAIWALYYLFRWRQLASVIATPEEAGVLDTPRFQRMHLERQRDARRRSWRWLFLPTLPIFALFIVSEVLEQTPPSWGAATFLVAWLVFGGGLTAWVAEYEARRFQREIDALDSLGS